MASHNWVRSTSFKTGMIYGVFFLTAVLLIFAATYWSVRSDMRSAVQTSVAADAAHLVSEYKAGGMPALKEAVVERLAETQGFDHVYLLIDAEGQRVSGNLAVMPVPGGAFEGEAIVTTGAAGAGTPPVMVLGETLSLADAKLFVGRNATQMDETLEILLSAMAMGSAITAAAALLLGVTFGLFSTRRVEQLGIVSRSVVNSGLKDRLPRNGSGDEFDRLSADINIMLDRIQELMESMRQISNDIAHELRTPLSRLRNGLEETLAERSMKSGGYRAAISESIGETDAIIGTFNALLRIAQIEGGARRGNFRQIDLSGLVQDVFEIYQPVASDANIVFDSRITGRVNVLGDGELLTQLIVNLVENSIRYVPGGGHVLISLTQGADHAVLTVSDDGPGIPEAERGKVFRRLYRVEESRTTPGSGLGLSLVKSIANLHGAAVTLEDNMPGLAAIVEIPLFSSNPR